ncbi:MAG: N-acetyltransferase [Pseudomonadales bacterium]|nr:MAG: N-acetyltransferase [Pseudomonadales bacterium]
MIELRDTVADELATFCEMDRDADTREHITLYSLKEHQREFERADIVYLSIYAASKLAGYFILALDPDSRSVEFRRIVVSAKGSGIGQAAIAAMETYCIERLQRQRIWLDVFESNSRGRHIYQKLGYRQCDNAESDGRNLLLMQKHLGAGVP